MPLGSRRTRVGGEEQATEPRIGLSFESLQE